jgi:hypothetical protein
MNVRNLSDRKRRLLLERELKTLSTDTTNDVRLYYRNQLNEVLRSIELENRRVRMLRNLK